MSRSEDIAGTVHCTQGKKKKKTSLLNGETAQKNIKIIVFCQEAEPSRDTHGKCLQKQTFSKCTESKVGVKKRKCNYQQMHGGGGTMHFRLD